MAPCLRGAFGADDLSRKLNSFRAPLQDHVLILLQSSFDSGLIADIHPRDDATEFQRIFDSNDSTFAAPCSRQKMSWRGVGEAKLTGCEWMCCVAEERNPCHR